MQDSDRHRVDTWLKLVCLFKHRSDASDACKGGHVKVNGQRVKPSSVIRVGDLVEITFDDVYRRVVVEGLPLTNISKESARTMYLDQTPAREKVEAPMRAIRERGVGRPTKKERRQIERMRRGA